MSEILINTLKKDEGLLKRATQIKTRKGVREKNYTIGYGYNLSAQKDPRGDLIEAGVDEEVVDDVIAGKAEIDEVQASQLLTLSAVRAKQDAIRVVANFDKLPAEVQEVVVNMSYQLGPTGLKGFKNFREALWKGDFSKAADEVLDSELARKDAPDRANRHAEALRKVAKQQAKQKVEAPSSKEKIDSIKKEILYQRAVQARQGTPDPLVPKLAELFKSMRQPDNNTAATETTTPGEVPTNASP